MSLSILLCSIFSFCFFFFSFQVIYCFGLHVNCIIGNGKLIFTWIDVELNLISCGMYLKLVRVYERKIISSERHKHTLFTLEFSRAYTYLMKWKKYTWNTWVSSYIVFELNWIKLDTFGNDYNLTNETSIMGGKKEAKKTFFLVIQITIGTMTLNVCILWIKLRSKIKRKND